VTARSRGRSRTYAPAVLTMLLFVVGAGVVVAGRDAPAGTAFAIAAPAAAAMIAVGQGARCRGRLRAGWFLIGAAMLSNAVGDLIWQALLLGGDEPRGVSAADPAYLATYPLLLAGVWLLVSALGRTTRDVYVDATIIAVFAGLGLWQFLVVNPGLSGATSLLEHIVFSAYPLAGTLTVAAVVAIVIAPHRMNAQMRLVAAFGLGFLACDVLFAVIQNAGLDGLRGISDGSYLVAYGILAAAALLPPARMPDVRPADALTFGRRRLVLLGIALVGAPVCAGLAPALDYASQAPIYIAVAALVSSTVMIRLVGLVRRLEEERRRLRAAESELAFRATHDDLTELPNRAFLITSLTTTLDEQAAVGGPGFAVMFIDLDNFKFVNDSLGHRAGDLLLGHVGRRIRQAMKTSDLVARLGGDEFVVLCRGVLDGDEAERIAARALEALAAPFSLDGDIAYTAASIGIGIAIPGDGHDAATLLRDADLALYQAKAAGGRCARVFDHTMQAWADERTSVETGLRRALDRGELAVMYQPRVDLATGRIRSLEALLRWPGRPEVPIPRLIDVAETSGLIDEIGWFVLSRACDDLARLNAAAGPLHPVSVAVNVSMRQINRGTFVEDVQRTIAMHGVDPSLISLELTETFLAAEPERALAMLTALRAVGVRLEIDDFGTGYSSLGRLRLFPLDGLKIDRSFVAGLGEDPSAESLIATIVALASALDLEVTAEGIECARQADLVRGAGCDLGQGFFFARPASVDEITALLASPDRSDRAARVGTSPAGP
jgi:diguanylate cyclase (GGDEF)-like protein